MLNKPDIKRAIPQRRYNFGEFTLVMLGEIESGDAVNYRYILAVVREGDDEPGIYVTCEQGAPPAWQLRVVMRDGAQVVAEDAGYQDADAFATAGLEIVRQLLNLGDEEPYRLL
ncbi:MAG: hypothetical protein WCY26_07940 [Thiohalobacteraceae bacterium]|nr:hypothetical protein [Gammaproteobacteria bacterium]